MSETYTCSVCGGTFKKAWTEAGALAEAEALFPGLAPSDRSIVCDVCFRRFMAHEAEFWKSRRKDKLK